MWIHAAVFFFLFSHGLSFAGQYDQQSIDLELRKYIEKFNTFTPPDFEITPAKYQLGKKLFFDERLSGNTNISCASCHSPEIFTVDWLPLSIGQGGEGRGLQRIQSSGEVTRRITPPLFNLHLQKNHMMWDGAVHFNGQYFEAPLEAISGKHPVRSDITQHLQDALDAFVLHPLIDPIEMLGYPHQNDIAKLNDPELMLDALFERVQQDPSYQKLIQKAFPQVDAHDWNIGLVANSIADYMRFAFQDNQTPWHRYVNGDIYAIGEKEKKGARIFFNQGQCIQCHHGPHFSDMNFHNNASPILSIDGDIDLGRYHVTKEPDDKFKFKTPALINVAFTFPYMHDGALFTINHVVNHYRFIDTSAKDHTLFIHQNVYKNNYHQLPILINSNAMIDQLLSGIALPLQKNMGQQERFSEKEKRQLVAFLRNALSNSRWRPRTLDD